MTKRKALGSGLDSLLSSARRVTESETSDQLQSPSSLPVHKIVRNRHQPRKVFHENEIKHLADSINENGQISPIVVRKMGEKFELIVGERRWRAIQLLRRDTIDAVIIDADEKTSAVLSIVENVQREDLNSMEEAESLLRLVNEFGMSHDDVSKYISKSRTHVTNLIRLNDLSDYGKEQLRIGTITMGHARAVLTLPLDEQSLILREAVRKNLSVRAVENLAKPDTRTKFKNKDPDTAILERQLSESLGAKINIKHGKSGGVISIKYSTMNELQGIIEKIRNTNKK
uniref:Putative chromosome partitioning protein ParB n=1 Tax=uncultured bacterium EIL5A08 TaxID=1768204 RepID=A0A0U2XPP7_9BACT|nr:putative chromosome partitioning protein ParB [uncultured bacterium EIL5A08]